ncbi:unnamed protein product [Triticum turgidum subsp. durum]|uniref:Peroxidase n=1 Tax=Triticum turgidum subsp. durum TaxID=4567 RepID=A0A9R0T0A1_TRITD|nr:unnamed protein product [Triticum turgidum subsp. durum]
MAARAIVALSLILALVAIASGGASAQLSSGFYSRSCPGMLKAVRSALHPAIATERRVGASIVRLFFHDCFVQGCDASLLLELDDAPGLRGEKNATPNKNSARGFEVIDAVKAAVEECCPGVVSCADILAIAAEESVVFLGGPSWEVKMGRRDSTTASFIGAENNIRRRRRGSQTLRPSSPRRGSPRKTWSPSQEPTRSAKHAAHSSGTTSTTTQTSTPASPGAASQTALAPPAPATTTWRHWTCRPRPCSRTTTTRTSSRRGASCTRTRSSSTAAPPTRWSGSTSAARAPSSRTSWWG